MSNPGLYIAAAGGMAQYERLEHLTNNLANVGTTGYKGDRPIFSVEHPNYSGQLRQPPAPGSAAERRALAFVQLDEVDVDMRLGGFETTNNPLNIALGGEGMLAVRGPDGPLYTRAGDLKLDSEGRLVNQGGLPVLAEGGEDLRVPAGDVAIDAQGNLRSGARSLGTLKIVTFDPSVKMERVGHTLFKAVGTDGLPAEGSLAVDPQVMQGMLETSNVNPVTAMVDLISTNRAFEQFTKSLESLDQLDEKAISQMARPR